MSDNQKFLISFDKPFTACTKPLSDSQSEEGRDVVTLEQVQTQINNSEEAQDDALGMLGGSVAADSSNYGDDPTKSVEAVDDIQRAILMQKEKKKKKKRSKNKPAK